MSVGIYKYTNKINGKSYIGKSKVLEQRKINHKSNAFNPNENEYTTAIHQAFRKYGIENFIYEVIEYCKVEELEEKEIFWISYYNTYYDGYNCNKGGDNTSPNNAKITEKELEEITTLLKENKKNNKEIAELFPIDNQTISGINTGRIWKRDIEYPIRPRGHYCEECGNKITHYSKTGLCQNCYHKKSRKIERPSAIELAEDIVLNGFSSVARKYNVSDNAIKKWCVSYGMGKLKSEVAT